MENVGVDIVLSSRLLSSGEVLRFVRKAVLFLFHCWKVQKQKRWKLFYLMTVRS